MTILSFPRPPLVFEKGPDQIEQTSNTHIHTCTQKTWHKKCVKSLFSFGLTREERNKKCWLRLISKERAQETSVSCGGRDGYCPENGKTGRDVEKRKRLFKSSVRIKCNGSSVWETMVSSHHITSHPVVFLISFLSWYSPSYTILVYSIPRSFSPNQIGLNFNHHPLFPITKREKIVKGVDVRGEEWDEETEKEESKETWTIFRLHMKGQKEECRKKVRVEKRRNISSIIITIWWRLTWTITKEV